jgi:tetratricopeptide (TPR) repeat protein
MPSNRSSHLPRWLQRVAAQFYYLRGNFHRHFGNTSGDRREYQWAVDNFTRAIELHPNFVSAHFNRGVLYWRELANFYRAVQDMTRVLELAPGRDEAWFNRAIAHHMRGEIPQAIEDLEHYINITHDVGWRTNAQNQLELIKAVAAEREEVRNRR